jgi:AcrR family transcriptional regulator
MGRPSHADGQKTRQAILDAALDLFAGRGYFGTSLRDIAAVVGVRESAIYNYFPSKELLFDAIIGTDHEQRMEQFLEFSERPVTDARLTLERLAMMALDHYCTRRQRLLFGMVMADGMRLAREGRINLLERMSSGLTPVRGLMQKLMREGWLRRADPAHLVLEFMGPLVLWRQMHAIRADAPTVRARGAFARGHVGQFLLGAGAGRAGRAAIGRDESARGRRSTVARKPAREIGRSGPSRFQMLGPRETVRARAQAGRGPAPSSPRK